jgi:hypothetical protein
MPCPYNIILGRDTALPSPLYHSGATGIDITGGQDAHPTRNSLFVEQAGEPVADNGATSQEKESYKLGIWDLEFSLAVKFDRTIELNYQL